MAFLTIILEWFSAALSTYKCVMVLWDTNVKRIEARVSPRKERDGKGTGEGEAGGMGLPEERRANEHTMAFASSHVSDAGSGAGAGC